MKDVLIAIILVNYNGIDDTINCVKSILESDYPNYKIIIVDNDSLDKEKIVSNQFLNEKADIIISKKNVGFSGGNNIGIQYAMNEYNPEYYLLLNNDTVILPNTLSELVKYRCMYERTGIVTGKIYYFSDPNTAWYSGGIFNFNTGLSGQPPEGLKDGSTDYMCREVTFASGCLMLIHKNIIEKAGLLGEEFFLYAEDTDYCCRVMQAGYKIIYVPSAVIYHKVSASAGRKSAMQQYYMMRNDCYIIKRYCRFPLYGYARKWYRVIKDILRGQGEIKIYVRAWKDFRHDIMGRVEGF